jgi:hypothetical protein
MEKPLPMHDIGIYDVKVYGPTGEAAQLFAVHSYSVAVHSKAALDLGWHTTTKLAESMPTDDRLQSNVAAWAGLRTRLLS